MDSNVGLAQDFDAEQSGHMTPRPKEEHNDDGRMQRNRNRYEAFMTDLTDFARSQGLPSPRSSTVSGKPLNLYMLYGIVQKVIVDNERQLICHRLEEAGTLVQPSFGLK